MLGIPVHIVMIDITQAFEKVNHVVLLHKFQYHGIVGKVLRWIEANWLSEERLAATGVHDLPQASELGHFARWGELDKQMGGWEPTAC